MYIMKRIFIPYLVAFAVFQAVVITLLLSYPKAELHLLLNSWHGDALDVFMRYYSMFAEFPVYVVALLGVFLVGKRWIAFYASCELSAALLVQIIKRICQQPRPSVFFADLPQYNLPVVPGVHLHGGLSFPSGHTSTFFIFFTCCALLLAFYSHRAICTRKAQGRSVLPVLVGSGLLMVVFVFLAALGGYSRVYLSQHFLLDVCVGSIIGVVVPCLIAHFFPKKGGVSRMKLTINKN